GIFTLIGALTNAEIAGMIDATGGQYKYFRAMFGDFIAFIYGWSILAVIQTGSQASIAVVFSEYLGYFFKYPQFSEEIQKFSIYVPLVGNIYPLQDFGTKAIAILCLLFLTGINYIGVVFGGSVQTVVTFVKIASILILAALAFSFGSGDISNVYTGFVTKHGGDVNMISMFGLALAGAFWAYDGWNNVTFVAGEVKDPKRNVPRALFVGTLMVMIVYIIINLAYLYVIPVEEIAKSPLVGATVAEIIFGPIGGAIISIAIVISTFGAVNGSILATARVNFAMARDNMFFKKLGESHPKYMTPGNSLIVQGIWSSILTLTGTFDTITDYVIFASWLFYGLGAYGVFVLRKKMPNTPRPYKVIGYPVLPAIFVGFSILFVGNTIISDTSNAMMGLILVSLGVPFYIYWKYIGRKRNQ
ncbi:MAG: amino acid permease, partial [Bacteroidetes bacterium]|nr:amino acid permease [Bacteroidota bacterium]